MALPSGELARERLRGRTSYKNNAGQPADCPALRYLSVKLQQQVRDTCQHQQVHRVEPVKGLFLQWTARAALPVIEPDQHKGQRCGELEQKQQRTCKALPLAVCTGEVQRADDDHADGMVVGAGSQRQCGAPARPYKPLPAGQAVFLFKALEPCHGQHAQRQRPVNVLCTEVKGGAVERKVKGYFAQKAEQHQPPKVAFDVVGVHKALHQQKAEQGKGQPSGEAQHHVQPVQRIGGKGVLREGAGVQPGRKDTRLDAGRTDVVHQHGDAGNGFKSGAAEAEAAVRGKCGHKNTSVSL